MLICSYLSQVRINCSCSHTLAWRLYTWSEFKTRGANLAYGYTNDRYAPEVDEAKWRFHSYNLLSLSPRDVPRHPLSVAPPSISIALPVMCALAFELRNSTNPPKSLGLPMRPVGCPAVRAFAYFSRPKFVIRLGKTPGQITLTMMFFGASFDAVIFVRWMAAAFAGPSVIVSTISLMCEVPDTHS